MNFLIYIELVHFDLEFFTTLDRVFLNSDTRYGSAARANLVRSYCVGMSLCVSRMLNVRMFVCAQ